MNISDLYNRPEEDCGLIDVDSHPTGDNYGKKTDRLFILGNGFDLSHNLSTSYEHFKAFLLRNYQYINGFENRIPNPHNADEIVTFIVNLLSKGNDDLLWKDIESSVGNIDEYVSDYINQNLDFDTQRLCGLILGIAIEKIPKLFYEWVNSIDISSACSKSAFHSLINQETDAFLTFNYTTVLEDIYGIDAGNICHIHGKQHSRIVFGHGEDLTYRTEFLLLDDLDCGLLGAYSDLTKDTAIQLKEHKAFFDQLKFLKSIYTYGFSFSKPDIPYLSEICKKTSRDTVWFLSDYEDYRTRELYQKVLIRNGFVGEFDTFCL